MSDACGASKVRNYVGQADSADLRARVEAAVGHSNIRWVEPGQMTTGDHNDKRLRVEIGDDGNIESIRCG